MRCEDRAQRGGCPIPCPDPEALERGTLQGIPEARIDQRSWPIVVGVDRRVDIPIFARFSVTVVEDDDACAEVANGINAFKLAARIYTIGGINIHAGGGPPQTAAPFQS